MRRFIGISLALAIVLGLNFISRKNLPYAYSDIVSYNKLYYADSQLRISRLYTTAHDSLVMEFKGKGITQSNLFELYANNRLLLQQQAPVFTLRPPTAQKQFFLRVNGAADSVEINIDYTPVEVYRASGNSGDVLYDVSSAALPVTNEALHPVSDWQAPEYDGGAAERQRADTYLQDSMHIGKGDAPAVKVYKIAAYILNATRGKLGTASDSTLALSPLSQLEAVRDGPLKLWCGNYSDIFSFFAGRAGVPVRPVSCGVVSKGVGIGEHTFNEVYLEDVGCWAYVDLTAQNIFVKNGEEYLNVIDVQRYLRHGVENSGLTAVHYNGDSISPVPFEQADSVDRYYFHPGNYFYFYYGDFLKRREPKNLFERAVKFFYTRPYQAVYSDNLDMGNWQLYTRVATNYLLAALFLLWLFAAVAAVRGRGAKP